MKNLFICVLCFFSASIYAGDWVNSPSKENVVSSFLKTEIQAEGNHTIKIKKVQQDRRNKNLFRVFAIVENSYVPEVGEKQEAVSCDIIYITKIDKSYQIVSWNKEECSIEDIILLKQI